MAEQDLSPEEMNRIYEGSAAVLLVTLFFFLAFFVYLMNNNAVPTLWLFLLNFVLPATISGLMVWALTFEFLYHRKTKKSLRFHVKRVVGRVTIGTTGIVSFTLSVLLADFFLGQYFGSRSFLVGSAAWFLIFAILTMKFRNFLRKLDSGRW